MRRGSRGVTLIELVLAIVVIGTALAGVLSVLNLSAAASADPVLRTQAQAVARAYLEEILARSFADPDGVEAGEDRTSYDDVDDYDALAANGCLSTSAACPNPGDCACNQRGDPIDALAGYRVAVAVGATTLGGAPALRADVTVTHVRAPDLRVTMSGYRTSY